MPAALRDRPTHLAMLATMPDRRFIIPVLFGLAASAVVVPSSAHAQIAARVANTPSAPSFTLVPRAACLHLSTMQISTNSQQAMRSGAQNHNSSRSNRTSAIRVDAGGGGDGSGVTTRAQNHNSSRSNRTEPMPRPDIVTDDADGDGFPDMLEDAALRIVGASDRTARSVGGSNSTLRLEIGDPDADDDAISDLVDATTFRVVEGGRGERGSPLHEASTSAGESPLFEGSASPGDGPIRTWTYALVPAAGGTDLDGDGWEDVLTGATVHITERSGRFHVDLELAETGARAGSRELIDAPPSFSVGTRSAPTGR